MIDMGRQRVIRGETVIALPRLSYDLLITLIRAAPNLVSNDQLMEQVWPKIVVSPETVSQRVKLVRDALGDDPRQPLYIEGLRGRGYRIIPEVIRGTVATGEVKASIQSAPPPASAEDLPSLTPNSAVPPTARAVPRRTWMLIAGVATVILVSVISIGWRRQTAGSHGAPTRVEVRAVPSQRPAVAVLPFDSLSAEPGNEYVALGIAESVLNRLGSNRELIVVSRSSSFALGNPRPDAREAGRRLGVRYVVGGSVQRTGRKLRVNAQLVDTDSNRELWSLSLDRTIDDVFAVEDEIAQQVGARLDVSLRGNASTYAQFGTDAYLAYLRGRALVESRKIDDVEASIRQFYLALDRAPTFGEAMVELADAKLLLADLQGEARGPQEALWSEVKLLIDRAITLDPSAGEPYYLRGRYKLEVMHDTGGADADFAKGLELAPGYRRGLDTVSSRWLDQGRYAQVVSLMDRASVIDPLSPRFYFIKGEAFRVGYGDWKQAAAAYLQSLEVAPDFYPAMLTLALVSVYEGQLAEGIKLAERSVAIEPKVAFPRQRLAWFYIDIGDLAAARDVLKGLATAPAASSALEAMICYRAGDLVRADSLARKAIKGPEPGTSGLAFFLATEAITTQAIAARSPGAARQAILSITEFKKEHGTLTAVTENFPAIVQLAAMETAVGDAEVGKTLAQRSLMYLNDKGHFDAPGEDERERAATLALLGQNEQAMTHLENLLHRQSRLRWWSTLERDPSFRTLRATPRFQAIAAEMQTWVAVQQQLLRQMRQRGDVPGRSAPALAGGC